VRLPHTDWQSAWRLGREGFRKLQELKARRFASYRDVTPTFMPHLLSTNQVWLQLAQGERVWGKLPYRWRGSHHAGIPYVSDLPRKRRLLRPDAIIEPAAYSSGRRIFIELDRSTECIRERDEQRSITGKLKAYNGLLNIPHAGLGRVFYKNTFNDELEPFVLFVLTRVDVCDRRRRNILGAAKKVFGAHYAALVGAVYLTDTKLIHRICGLPPVASIRQRTTARRSVRPSSCDGVHVTQAQLHDVKRYYRESVEALRKFLPRDRRNEMRAIAKTARVVLQQWQEKLT